jgi:hypothetical protein
MNDLYADVAARIVANCPAVLQVTTGARPEELVEMLAIGPDVAALVHPISTVADPVREAGMMVAQREVWRFGVSLALTFPGGFAQFEPARDQVKATLRGWMAPGASMPVEFAAQRTLEFDAGEHGGRWLEMLEFTVPTVVSYEVQS